MSRAPIDPKAFRDFERAVHNSNANTYHDLFREVTDQAIAPLLDAAGVGPGMRFLDVAAGPGGLAGEAARRGARATGVDLAPAMVALASRLHPGVEFHEGSADQLPFDDASFDAVACAFGLGHFPEPERAVAEFARVLAPGRRVALAWWDDFSRSRINGIFFDALARRAQPTPNAPPAGPPMDRYSDRDRFAELLRSAGFDAVRVEAVSFRHRLRDAEALWELGMGSLARVSSMIRAQTEAIQEQIRLEVADMTRTYASDAQLDLPVAFLVASGVRQ
jgi:SAM-dependent methyltransferase